MKYYIVTMRTGKVLDETWKITSVEFSKEEETYDFYSNGLYIGTVNKDFVTNCVLRDTEIDTKGA